MQLIHLKEWRAIRGLSLRELADKSGVNYSALSLLENLRRGAQPRTVRKIATALSVEVRDLYGPEPTAPAPILAQPKNNNETITEPTPAVTNPARARAKKQKPAVNSYWVIEQGQEDADPFSFETREEAERLKARLPGKAKVYEAVSKAEAREQHRAFLTREARGYDAW